MNDWRRDFAWKHGRNAALVLSPQTPRKLGHHLARRSRRGARVAYGFTRHGDRIANIRRGRL